MQGVEGQIFNPMARTYGFALLGALISTFTVTPVLASFLLPKEVKETETVFVRVPEEDLRPRCKEVGARTTVARPWPAACSSVIAAACLGAAHRHRVPARPGGRQLLDPRHHAAYHLCWKPRKGKVSARARHPEIATLKSSRSSPSTDVPTTAAIPSSFGNVELFVPLKPFDQWEHGLTKEKLVNRTPGSVRQGDARNPFPQLFPNTFRTTSRKASPGVKGANAVKIIGPDMKVLEGLATKVMAEMGKIRGVTDLGVFRVLGQPNFNITVDRGKAARYGLNAGDAGTSSCRLPSARTQATTVIEGERQFALNVRLTPESRESMEAIKNIPVAYTNSEGTTSYVALKELATCTLETGASYIYHETGQRFIPVKFSVRGRDLGGTVAEIQSVLAKKVELPHGYRYVSGG